MELRYVYYCTTQWAKIRIKVQKTREITLQKMSIINELKKNRFQIKLRDNINLKTDALNF